MPMSWRFVETVPAQARRQAPQVQLSRRYHLSDRQGSRTLRRRSRRPRARPSGQARSSRRPRSNARNFLTAPTIRPLSPNQPPTGCLRLSDHAHPTSNPDVESESQSGEALRYRARRFANAWNTPTIYRTERRTRSDHNIQHLQWRGTECIGEYTSSAYLPQPIAGKPFIILFGSSRHVKCGLCRSARSRLPSPFRFASRGDLQW